MLLEAVDYQSTDAPKLFVESLRNTGFGVIKNHPISEALLLSIYKNWQDFFTSENKHDYRFTEKYDGFFPAEISETAKGHTTKDIKEYFHYYEPWGQCPPELKAEIANYRMLANNLAIELLSWVDQNTPTEVSTNFSEPLSSMIEDSTQTLLRVLHYPPLQGDEPQDAIRAAAHEDINLLTVLPAANEPGLQVKLNDGTWFDVACDFGNIIINSGDMLQEASKGYYKSTTHRVVNPPGSKNQSRISLPLFLHPRPEVRLSERCTADEYLQERLRELGVA